VPNRYLAGITEVALKNYYADKTNWRKMLTNSIEPVDLLAERLKLEKLVRSTGIFLLNKNDLYEMHYPVMHYPTKVKSLSLEKTPIYRKIDWQKGQYLLFEDGTVFNIRSSEG
jgi:hypothetical protein